MANLVPLGLKELEALELKRWWNPRLEGQEGSPAAHQSEGRLSIPERAKTQPPSIPLSALSPHERSQQGRLKK